MVASNKSYVVGLERSPESNREKLQAWNLKLSAWVREPLVNIIVEYQDVNGANSDDEYGPTRAKRCQC